MDLEIAQVLRIIIMVSMMISLQNLMMFIKTQIMDRMFTKVIYRNNENTRKMKTANRIWLRLQPSARWGILREVKDSTQMQNLIQCKKKEGIFLNNLGEIDSYECIDIHSRNEMRGLINCIY